MSLLQVRYHCNIIGSEILVVVGKPVQVCCTGKGINKGRQFVQYERNALPPDSGVSLINGDESESDFSPYASLWRL